MNSPDPLFFAIQPAVASSADPRGTYTDRLHAPFRPSVGRDFVIEISGRRRLCGRVYGSDAWQQVFFYFHGFPGSRLEGAVADQAAQRLGVTIVALDRPGIGGTPFDSAHSVARWPLTVAEVADACGVERFGVCGVSGGTPWTLACAALLPARVSSVLVVSGVSRTDERGVLRGMIFQNFMLFLTARSAPWCARAILSVIGSVWRVSPASARLWLRSVVVPCDREILMRPAVAQMISANIAEALRDGVRGVVHDFLQIAGEWGISLGSIIAPVSIVHGAEDTYVPLAMAECNARLIAKASLRIVPNAGHFMAIDLIGDCFEKHLKALG